MTLVPEWYVNLTVRCVMSDQSHRLAQTAGPGALANAVMARLLKAVHGVAAAQNFSFAVAFPLAQSGRCAHPGNLIQVFLSARESADGLLESLETHEFLMGYVHLDRPRKVPQSVASSVSYQLCRTTSRKNNNVLTRQRQLERGNAMPYVRMLSSNGESFSLRFDIVRRALKADTEGHTNGYGLSTRAVPFFLPDIPVEPPPWHANARNRKATLP